MKFFIIVGLKGYTFSNKSTKKMPIDKQLTFYTFNAISKTYS